MTLQDLLHAPDLLHAYVAAFAARDAETISSLFAPNALYELPLLGQRLVGPGEIRAGLGEAFGLMEAISIDVSAVTGDATVAIAEGRLAAKLRRDPTPVEMPLAMVVESSDGRIHRLTTHLDARPYRLWCDGPVFAAAG